MSTSGEIPARGHVGALLFACVALGLVIRGVEARSSLWLDELHTLFVAATPGIVELNAVLVEDTHTPLYYLVVQLFHGTVSPLP